MKSTDRPDAMKAPGGSHCQVLTFTLGAQEFGVDVLSVREIRGWTQVTPLPHTPACVLGVLDLRGSILPVIELRTLLGLARTEVTPLTVIIVVGTGALHGQQQFGLVVDQVSDVVGMDGAQIMAPPALGNRSATGAIRGLAAVAARMLVLLDVDALLGGDLQQVIALTDHAA